MIEHSTSSLVPFDTPAKEFKHKYPKRPLITTLFDKEKAPNILEKTRVHLYCYRNLTDEASYLLRKSFFLKSKNLRLLRCLTYGVHQLLYRFKVKPKRVNFLSNCVRTLHISSIPNNFSVRNKGANLFIKQIKRFKQVKFYKLSYELTPSRPNSKDLIVLLSQANYMKEIASLKIPSIRQDDRNTSQLDLHKKILEYMNRKIYLKSLILPIGDDNNLTYNNIINKSHKLKALEINLFSLESEHTKMIVQGLEVLQNLDRLSLRFFSNSHISQPDKLELLFKNFSGLYKLKHLQIDFETVRHDFLEISALNSIIGEMKSLETLKISLLSSTGEYRNFWNILKKVPRIVNLDVSAAFTSVKLEEITNFTQSLSEIQSLQRLSLNLLAVKKYSLEYSITPTVLKTMLISYSWLENLKVLILAVGYCIKKSESWDGVVSGFLSQTKNLKVLSITVGENFLTSSELCNITNAIGTMNELRELSFTGNFIAINETGILSLSNIISQMKCLDKLVLKLNSIKSKYFKALREVISNKYRDRRCYLNIVPVSFYP